MVKLVEGYKVPLSWYLFFVFLMVFVAVVSGKYEIPLAFIVGMGLIIFSVMVVKW